jgi:hypothetical protein
VLNKPLFALVFAGIKSPNFLMPSFLAAGLPKAVDVPGGFDAFLSVSVFEGICFFVAHELANTDIANVNTSRQCPVLKFLII